MWLSPLSGGENWVQEMVPRQRWLGRDVWAWGSTRTGRAANSSSLWLSSPGVRAPMAGKLFHPCVPGGCWSYITPTWCPGYPAFNKLFPRKQDQTFFPADLCLLSSKPFLFPPVHPVLSLFPRSTSHNPSCKLGAPSLLCFFSVPFPGLTDIWRGVKCHR